MSNSIPDGTIDDATRGRVDRPSRFCRPGSSTAGEPRRSKSRKKRKRDRRRAEATTQSLKIKEGWGHGLPVSNSDLLLVRRAIREAWPTSQQVRDLVVQDAAAVALSEPDLPIGRLLAVVRAFVAMEQANQDAGFQEQGRKLLCIRRLRVRRLRGTSRVS